MQLQSPEKGRIFQFPGAVVTFRAVAADTGGAFSLFDGRIGPQQGVPLHLQHYDDEAFFVLEGTFHFQIGNQQVQLGPGEFAFVSKETPHAWLNIGTGEGRLLFLTLPGGFHERYFAEIGEPVTTTSGPLPMGAPDVEKMIAAGQRCGIEVLPPASEQKG